MSMTPSPNPAFSIVIPVFNSAGVVAETVTRTIAFFDRLSEPYEIILVNDGSTDGSWKVIEGIGRSDPRVIAVDLLKNYGQHTAVFCGLEQSRGELVLTIDDDLQNPPEELAKLIDAARSEGHDLVVGRFAEKKHSFTRRLGSKVINRINTRIFGKPDGMVLTNVRCMHRSVVDRVVAHRTTSPYINGLTIMYSGSPVNVLIEHRDREVGTSNYTARRIATLVFRILFNYSSWPLRFVSNIGLVATVVSMVFGVVVLVRAAMGNTEVPGWASVAVLLAFFNGVSLLILSMLGEYTVRMLNQMNQAVPYHVRARVRAGAPAGRGAEPRSERRPDPSDMLG